MTLLWLVLFAALCSDLVEGLLHWLFRCTEFDRVYALSHCAYR